MSSKAKALPITDTIHETHKQIGEYSLTLNPSDNLKSHMSESNGQLLVEWKGYTFLLAPPNWDKKKSA